MSASVVKQGGTIAPRTWGGGTDENGWTTYDVQWLVKCTEKKDGPDKVLHATDLPAVGATWVFGNDSRADIYRLPGQRCKTYRGKENSSGFYWTVDQTFSNKATFIGSRPVVSVAGQKYTKEIQKDRFGRAVLSTSHELIRGPQVEFDFNRTQVKIEKALSSSSVTTNLPVWFRLANAGVLNSVAMWGVPARCIKMEPFVVTEKFDENNNRYFTVVFEFTVYVVEDKDGNAVSGFDRDLLDEGTKALGFWDHPAGATTVADATWNTWGGDVSKPSDFFRYYDKAGNIARVILNTDGTPWDGYDPGPDDPPNVHVEHYPQGNLVTLLTVPDPLYG